MAAGKFITFEGGEGSGKSTQASLLALSLSKQGLEALLTREPGGSPFAERLRALLLDPMTEPHAALAEALVFYAARADHLERVIRPALAAGRWVLSDRFSDSTRVYQGLAGSLDRKSIDALEALVVGATMPQLTIIIDVPAEVGLARAAVRRTATPAPARAGTIADRFEGRDIAFHRRLRQGFLDIARDDPKRCVVVDGLKSREEIAATVWAAVAARFLAGAD
jgi:dTMP kinase